MVKIVVKNNKPNVLHNYKQARKYFSLISANETVRSATILHGHCYNLTHFWSMFPF